MASQLNEEELLDLARKYSFRSRMDRSTVAGPIMVWGRGSVVRDVNGKEYLDFNSGQMCAALGHNHPRIVQALQESCETLIHSHMGEMLKPQPNLRFLVTWAKCTLNSSRFGMTS